MAVTVPPELQGAERFFRTQQEVDAAVRGLSQTKFGPGFVLEKVSAFNAELSAQLAELGDQNEFPVIMPPQSRRERISDALHGFQRVEMVNDIGPLRTANQVIEEGLRGMTRVSVAVGLGKIDVESERGQTVLDKVAELSTQTYGLYSTARVESQTVGAVSRATFRFHLSRRMELTSGAAEAHATVRELAAALPDLAEEIVPTVAPRPESPDLGPEPLAEQESPAGQRLRKRTTSEVPSPAALTARQASAAMTKIDKLLRAARADDEQVQHAYELLQLRDPTRARLLNADDLVLVEEARLAADRSRRQLEAMERRREELREQLAGGAGDVQQLRHDIRDLGRQAAEMRDIRKHAPRGSTQEQRDLANLVIREKVEGLKERSLRTRVQYGAITAAGTVSARFAPRAVTDRLAKAARDTLGVRDDERIKKLREQTPPVPRRGVEGSGPGGR